MSMESLLGFAQKAGRLITGSTAVLRALPKGKVKLLLLAEDASERLAHKVRDAASNNDVPVVVWGTKERIGAVVGKRDLGVLAVCDAGFASALQRSVALGRARKRKV